MQPDQRRRTTRNLAIFTVVVLLCGWIGRGLDALTNAEPGQGIGQLVWIVTPLLTALLLRAFAGDGWSDFGLRPALRGNIGWYAISLLVYPAVVAVFLLLGRLAGAVTMPDLSAVTVASLGAALPMLLVFGFVKNIFEEFAWRGYLAPKTYELGHANYTGHTIVGLIWGGWHLPYLASISPHRSVDLFTMGPLFLLGAIAASIVYGEIRLATNSVWPAVLMHTVGGLVIGLLLFTYPITVADGSMTLFSLGVEGGLMIALMALAGVLLRRWRLAHDDAGTEDAA